MFPRLNGGAASVGSQFIKTRQISEGGEQVMKSDWGLGSSLLLRFSWESCPGHHKLPALVGSSARLFNFNGTVRGRMHNVAI
jgi:hypothetical protein